MRNVSYPFDWLGVDHISILKLVDDVLHLEVKCVEEFCKNNFNPGVTSNKYNVGFPHDKEEVPQVLDKYNRRVIRALDDGDIPPVGSAAGARRGGPPRNAKDVHR